MLFAEKEDEQITLQEFLERERRMEVEAGEALPGKFDKCTWGIEEKIVQPLYVCRSCVKEKENPAVVCYSCSISCHSKCDLIELYEKRYFRCDCGNSLFQSKYLKPYDMRHILILFI
jgi:E3 ubiquitin-protein ligase UBR7